MYYSKTMQDRIRVPPDLFGSKISDAVMKIVRERYERRIYPNIGMIISINSIKILSEGVVIPGDAGAYYDVELEALSFMPQVNEVYEAEIKETVEFGAFASIGPFQGLLHVSQISKEKFFYDKKTKTLGSRAEKKNLKKGDDILVKISTVSLKSHANETKIGLTMRPDGLGRNEWMERDKKAEIKVEKKKAKNEDAKGESK
ncbi:MAG: DNA-directed RNA polymerase [Candidatus Micrarchaeota archaeon]